VASKREKGREKDVDIHRPVSMERQLVDGSEAYILWNKLASMLIML